MKIYDISLPISPNLVTWPGQQKVELERVSRIEDGANSNGSLLTMHVHTGTHVDAPVHFLQGESGVETLPLEILTGPAQVVEFPPDVREINSEALAYAGLRPGVERVLLKTRNSEYWNNPADEFKPEFVAITADGAEFLVWQGVKLVGVDYLSVAPFKRSREPHEIFLKHNTVLVEGLDLRAAAPGMYQFICLPLKLVGSDGAPARAMLISED